MTFLFAQPNQLWLELVESNLSQAWQQISLCSSPTSRWRAYLNRLSLNAFLSYAQEELSSSVQVCPEHTSSSFWELVNGSTLILGNKRIAILPTEAMDEDELRVPQEWVDIPAWVADYYLAAQVNLDDQWVRIWGYTTHQQLKNAAYYDSRDRTYCLDRTSLFQDLNAFWVSQELAIAEVTQAAVTPLSSLSSPQAENLIERLGNAELVLPRLAVPFALWGALLENPSWRQQLCQRRQGYISPNPLVNLGRWLDNLFDIGWQPPETLNLAFSPQRRTQESIQRAKSIPLGTEEGVILLVSLVPESDDRMGVSLQLFPPSNNRYLPETIQLTLLSETGDILQSVQARDQDNAIRIPRFKCPLGFRFSLQITFNQVSITEDFQV